MNDVDQIARTLYGRNITTFHDIVDGECGVPWKQAAEDQTAEYLAAKTKAEEITKAANPQVALLKVIGKEGLLNEFADFTWYWGVDWFIETKFGNFHWKDPSYGPGDGSVPNTLTYFDGDIHKFRKFINTEMGRDKGSRFIVDKCGPDFELILPE